MLASNLFAAVDKSTRKNYTVITEPPFSRGWTMRPHSHVQYEIALVRGGECDILLESGRRQLIANQVFFIPSGLPHGFFSIQGVEFIVIQFPEIQDDLLRRLVNADPIGVYLLNELDRGLFTDLCYKLQREIAGRLPYTALQCEALLSQMMVLLLRSEERQGMAPLTPLQRQMIEDAVSWIHRNASESILIRDVASQFALSEAHFRVLFRRVTGTSPKQYLLALRLQASKCMLMHAEQSVADVATQAGFNSPQEFSKVFRRFTGVTPTAWRKAYLYDDVLSSG
ncbi:MAG: helix-turn-helix domain-containing protein [Anaerolineae bacterium]|nr:helix-turn-helix domain-containing protein [Anaerolineae bacterium]